jgi:hypothetical protein
MNFAERDVEFTIHHFFLIYFKITIPNQGHFDRHPVYYSKLKWRFAFWKGLMNVRSFKYKNIWDSNISLIMNWYRKRMSGMSMFILMVLKFSFNYSCWICCNSICELILSADLSIRLRGWFAWQLIHDCFYFYFLFLKINFEFLFFLWFVARCIISQVKYLDDANGRLL